MRRTRGARSKRNFILQQGLREPPPERCDSRYRALQFQPGVLAIAILAGVALDLPLLFFVIALVLWWNVLFPLLNPFDAWYNRTADSRPGGERLPPAPAPRRFAQALAGSISLAIGVFLLLGSTAVALALEVFLLLAVTALVFGRFCLGSFLYHLIRGRFRFARRTLPWASGA